MTNRLSICTSSDIMGTTLRRKQSIFEDPSFEVYKNIETKSVDSGFNSSQYTNSSNDNKDNTSHDPFDQNYTMEDLNFS